MSGLVAAASRDAPPLPEVDSFGSLLDYDPIAHSRTDWRIPRGERFSILVINKFREMCSREVAENDARWPLHFNRNAELRDRAIALVLVTIQVPSETHKEATSAEKVSKCSVSSIFCRRARGHATEGHATVIENASYGRVGLSKASSSSSIPPSMQVVRTATVGRKIHAVRREARAAFRLESERRMGSAGLRVLQSSAAKSDVPGGEKRGGAAKPSSGSLSSAEMMRREKMWRS